MQTRLLPPLLAGVAILAACSGESSGPSTTNQVTFSVSTSPVAATGATFLSDTIANGSDTLVLESVQLVLRDIRFERVDDSRCPDDDDDGHHGGEDDIRGSHLLDGDDDDNDSCEYSNAGPFLLDLPLGPGVSRAFSVAVDTGSYDELEIKLHKPEDDGDAKDAAFLAAHPDFRRISIRATGTFNGTPFTFESDLNAEQEIDLVPPIVVSDSAVNVDVTIQVATDGWFRNGSTVINPTTANKGGANDNVVRDNIRRSFRAFRDGDHDGCDDDDDDNSGPDD